MTCSPDHRFCTGVRFRNWLAVRWKRVRAHNRRWECFLRWYAYHMVTTLFRWFEWHVTWQLSYSTLFKDTFGLDLDILSSRICSSSVNLARCSFFGVTLHLPVPVLCPWNSLEFSTSFLTKRQLIDNAAGGGGSLGNSLNIREISLRIRMHFFGKFYVRILHFGKSCDSYA